MKATKKYQILEFNGLPGSGKSTITDRLICELKRNGRIVLSETDIFVQANLLNKIFDLAKALVDFKSIKLNYILLNIGIRSSIIRKTLKNIKSAVKIIRFNYLLRQQIIKGDFDFICLSEGFIQFIYCIYDGIEFFGNNELGFLLKEINKQYKNLLIINCNLSKEVALMRIEKRTSKPNTVDLMSKKDRLNFIELRNNNMVSIKKNVYNYLNTLEIDTLENIERNMHKILSTIEVKL